MAGTSNLDCTTLNFFFFQREASDCDSDSIASCSSESIIEKTPKKKLRSSSSSIHVMIFLSFLEHIGGKSKFSIV
ncbi:unnamed protein product [Brugia timori]|uniref:Ovule protein n=1 Tax=Brugia timori TaxID=42155 RepID=A0A0R3RD38_9BILA|nr:unnamed protein product [Brugia timori]